MREGQSRPHEMMRHIVAPTLGSTWYSVTLLLRTLRRSLIRFKDQSPEAPQPTGKLAPRGHLIIALDIEYGKRPKIARLSVEDRLS